jgi:hypothetical protein
MPCETVTISAPGQGESNVIVTSLAILGSRYVGDAATAEVNYENAGGTSGSRTDTVTINGNPVGDVSISLAGGEVGSKTIGFQVPDAQEMTASVEGISTSVTSSIEQPPDGGNGGGEGIFDNLPIDKRTAIIGASVVGAGGLYAAVNNTSNTGDTSRGEN